jgi:hypothetical protein
MKLENWKDLQGPVTLTCSCGAPLELWKGKPPSMDEHGEWCLGHKGCDTPGMHSPSLTSVLRLAQINVEKVGKPVMSREEFMRCKDAALLGDRWDTSIDAMSEIANAARSLVFVYAGGYVFDDGTLLMSDVVHGLLMKLDGLVKKHMGVEVT